MRVLAVEPYFGGSHRAFLEGWSARSRHEWALHTLPGHHWKWRMRLGALELAERLDEVSGLLHETDGFDVVWCSSMLDVALWRTVVPSVIASLPHVVYFHENQFAYPADPRRGEDERDVHFALTNLTSALAALNSGVPWGPEAAPRVWWNSAYNRDTFAVEARALLENAPSVKREAVRRFLPRVLDASAVEVPGVALVESGTQDAFGSPLHLLWAARWEHDKQPEVFFDALHGLERRGVEFVVSVLGERFKRVPSVFEQARACFAPRIRRWGYAETRAEYEAALREADVFVSTAAHEFFGIAAVEAASAGCTVVLPRRLAYPEVFGQSALFFDSDDQLPERLADLDHPRDALTHVRRYGWDRRAAALDDALDRVVNG